MIDLTHYIEHLLLTHECVIVPGLGGFVSQYASAYRVEEEQTFFPPYRTVGFNPQLKVNDGLLVQAYMESTDASYPEACRLISSQVDELLDIIRKEGSYTFEGIGTLRQQLNGSFHFVPLEAGVVSPELYGLTSFSMQRADRLKAVTSTPLFAESAKHKKSSRLHNQYTFRVNRTLAHYLITTAAAVIIYFCISVPVNNEVGMGQRNDAIESGMVFGLPYTSQTSLQQKAAASEAKPMAKPTDEATVVSSSATSSQPATANEKEVSEPSESPYYSVVLASSITKKNAEAYVEKLTRGGHQGAFVYKHKRMVRVLFKQYSSEADARAALDVLRSSDSDFSSAWVLKVKP